MLFEGTIKVPVEADTVEQAVERLASWAESCVQRVSGEGMVTKDHTVLVEWLTQHRNGEQVVQE